MKERWKYVSSESKDKQEKRFEKWIAGADIRFESEEKKDLYQQRCTLIKDAVQMKNTPARVPIAPSEGTFPLNYNDTSWKEAMRNPEALGKAYLKFAEDFDPDFTSDGRGVIPAGMLETLDVRLIQWAGHGVDDNSEYQYVEKEFMTADDYQDLIDDPSYWFLSVYFPKIFGTLVSFRNFPITPPVHEIPMLAGFTMPFADPAMAEALKKLMKAGSVIREWFAALAPTSSKLRGSGYPGMIGGFSKAPFDAIGDTLRGTREIMMDMFRRPELVIEACERLTPIMIKYGIKNCDMTGVPQCFIPLHKGADGFMSQEQFEMFYWPTLRKLIIGLVDAGVVPILFAEGGYNSRLDTIVDLPKGRCIWYFDRSDMRRVKETIGQVACIMGNVPLDLLYAGTPDEVRTYTKELLETAASDGGYIFAAGAGLQGAKAENIKAMIDYVKKHGVY